MAWRCFSLGVLPSRLDFSSEGWLFMPFFTGVIALPAFFITPGPAWILLALGIGHHKNRSPDGGFLLLRVSTSVSLGLLLILTTPWPTLLKALSVLRVPEGFLLILGMTYRYIYLLLLTAEDMFLSRRSRIVGRLNPAEARRILAASAGTLLNKSLALSGEVYLAMQSRGYRGQPRTVSEFQLRRVDWALGNRHWLHRGPCRLAGKVIDATGFRNQRGELHRYSNFTMFPSRMKETSRRSTE